MRPSSEPLPSHGVLRCAHCQDVIGVYEPFVEVDHGPTRQTSRAAQPGIQCSSGSCFHLGCFRALEAET